MFLERIDWRFWRVAFSIPVFILGITAYCFTTEAFLLREYGRPGFPSSRALSHADLVAAGLQTLRYVKSEASLEELIGLKIYNVKELSHLEDVRGMISQARLLLLILAAGVLLDLAGMFRSGGRGFARRTMRTGSLMALAGLGLLGLSIAANFNVFFLKFHALFFRPESYAFDPARSLLVHVFPVPFWVHTFTGAALLGFLLASITLASSWHGACEVENV